MGCNCGKRKGGMAATLQRSRTIRLEDGIYQTSGTNCTEVYHGDRPTRSLLVVAAGTENEQWFPFEERSKAVRLARDNDWTFDQLPAGSVCHETVIAVLGS